jgi:hypothetical protein
MSEGQDDKLAQQGSALWWMDLIETSRLLNVRSASLLHCSEWSRMFARWWCVLLPISSVLGINQTRPHIIFILADDLVSTQFCALRCVTWQNIHMGTACLILEECLATCCLRCTKLLTTLIRSRGTRVRSSYYIDIMIRKIVRGPKSLNNFTFTKFRYLACWWRRN